MTNLEENPLVVWRIVDGKRGHERQSEALVHALSALLAVTCVDVQPLSAMRALWLLLTGFKPPLPYQKPHLILGAGHATHLSLLAFRRVFGAKSVVLMSPSLPCAWFDLCIAPQHDALTGKNVLVTKGALNRMALSPHDQKASHTGLILLGGESKHYHWESARVAAQIKQLIDACPDVKWTISSSRRTPSDLLVLLRAQNIEITLFDAVDENWLPAQLKSTQIVWLTPDSASMLYEALTAGCRVGVFDLTPNQSNLALAVEKMANEGEIVRLSRWQQQSHLPTPLLNFNEAMRCAQWIKQQWF